MDNGRPILIVANPASCRGRGRRTASLVAEALRTRGRQVLLRETTARGDAERLALEACQESRRRPGCVVACGGDGTMQEVANALATARRGLGDACPAMGLAPAGRCNDLARALGVSREPSQIADVLAGGRTRATDLGRINGRYFCTVATVGLDAEVSSFVDSMRVPLHGTMAYLFGALWVLSRYRAPRVRLQGDFGTIDRPVFVASSANTSSYGGAIEIAPGAVPTDGLLDVCVIEAVSRRRALALIASVLRHRHLLEREVQLLRTRQLTVDADKPLLLWADGERVATTPAVIEAVPGAVHIALPAESSLPERGATPASRRN